MRPMAEELRPAGVEQRNRTYHEAQDRMELLPNYYRWTYGKFRRYLRGTVVELGCGAGIGIATYVNEASKVYAVDYNEELVARVARRFPGPKVVAIRADLLADWDRLAEIEADAVIMMDVLEHFADDAAVARKASGAVEAGRPSAPQGARAEQTVLHPGSRLRPFPPLRRARLARAAESVGYETVKLGN